MVPVIETLAASGIPVSIDTRRAAVASAAIAAGALVVNDVSGLRDPAMIEVVAAASVPAIVMHAPSADMAETHRHAGYTDVVADGARLPRADRSRWHAPAGVAEVVVDPGIGFGKSLDDNVTILRRLERVRAAWVVRCSSAPRASGSSARSAASTDAGRP